MHCTGAYIANDMPTKKTRKQPLPRSAKGGARKRSAPYLRRIESRGPLSIWLVDGAYVRKNIDIEFTAIKS